MNIGIVGSEAAKFTPETEAAARTAIRDLLRPDDYVVSGACHLGGIDVWAMEEAHDLGLLTREFPPATHRWENGYKLRNIQIAQCSDRVVCITVRVYPPGYSGMRFPSCYHCRTTDHIKSGGCWTVKYAREIGKPTDVIVVG